MSDPDYDEVARLHLELHHVKIQRDAFNAALSKAVQDIVREAVSRAVTSDQKLAENVSKVTEQEPRFVLKSDYDRLKAELEEYRSLPFMREAIASARLAQREGGRP